MRKYKTLIVDDEPLARARLKRLLKKYSHVDVVAEADNGMKAIQLNEQYRPDIIFLDIQMPGLNGIEVVESLDNTPFIVFVTSYDEYALKAFEINALDYLLKPITQERLDKTIIRAFNIIKQQQGNLNNYSDFVKTYRKQRYSKRLAVYDNSSILVVDVDQVDWAWVEGDTVFISLHKKAYRIRGTLEQLEKRLDPALFFKVHRSALVNLEKVIKVVPWFKNSYKLKLTTDEMVDLSRRRARVLRKILGY